MLDAVRQWWTVEVGCYECGYPVAHELEGGCSGALAGRGQRPFLGTLFQFRAEGYHIVFAVQDGPYDVTIGRVHNGVAVEQLRIVEFWLEVESRGAVRLLTVLILVVPSVVLVEGREDVAVAECCVIHVEHRQVKQGWHCIAVVLDSARE